MAILDKASKTIFFTPVFWLVIYLPLYFSVFNVVFDQYPTLSFPFFNLYYLSMESNRNKGREKNLIFDFNTYLHIHYELRYDLSKGILLKIRGCFRQVCYYLLILHIIIFFSRHNIRYSNIIF
uniref:Uncharacterized protein n=1 Tax=Cacopsylla melanoneura TaxID=428564 RepID=A0A8D8XF56_9HEMI